MKKAIPLSILLIGIIMSVELFASVESVSAGAVSPTTVVKPQVDKQDVAPVARQPQKMSILPSILPTAPTPQAKTPVASQPSTPPFIQAVQPKPQPVPAQPTAPSAVTTVQPTPQPVPTQPTVVAPSITPTMQPISPALEKWAVPETGKLYIGAALDLSRTGAEICQKFVNGIELAFYEANGSGGINGREIELQVKDDGSDPEKTLANIDEIRKFYKTDLIVGPYGWTVMSKIMDLTNKGEIISLFPWVTNADVRRPRAKNIINYLLGAYQEFSAVARKLIEMAHPKKVAVAYFRTLPDAYIDLLLKSNGITNYIRIVHAVTDADFSKHIEFIDKEKPDALVLMTPPIPSMSLIRAMKERINNMAVAANSGSVGAFFDKFVRGKAKMYIVGRAVPNPAMKERTLEITDKSVPGGKRMITLTIIDEFKAMIAKRKAEGLEIDSPNDETRFCGYICGRLLVMILRNIKGIISKEKFIASAESLQNISLGGLPLSYDFLKHQFSTYCWLDDGSEVWKPYYVGDIPFPPGFLSPEEEADKKKIEEKMKKVQPKTVPEIPSSQKPAQTAASKRLQREA